MTTSSLTTRITDYILKRTATTLTQLEGVVVSHGFTLDDLYTALEQVHRDKSIARTVKQGEVVYMKKVPPKSPTDHLAYIRNNYPPMTPDNDGSGIDADFSYLFLSPEELEKYKAEARGVQYIPSKRYGNKRKQSTV
jgi:hypothetical protein